MVREHIEGLVRYVSSAGRASYGTHPIDMTPMAYVSGAVHTLERLGAITHPELRQALTRCHDAYGLKPVPEPPAQASPGATAMAWEPEWADDPPWSRHVG